MEIKLNKDANDVIRNVSTIAKIIKKTSSRNSLTRMSQDTVFQFPLMMVPSIDIDDAMIIARAVEKQYAALLVSVFSLRGSINTKDYDNIQDYLKGFHNNSDIPSNIKAASRFVFESATTLNATESVAGLGEVCWDIVEEQINTGSLNDIYKPYAETKRILKDKLAVVTEAKSDRLYDNKNYQKFKDVATRVDRDRKMEEENAISPDTTTTTINPDTKEKKIVTSKATIEPRNINAVVRNDKLSALEPTMINVQFTMHGDGKQWMQNVVLGVKTMTRMIRSDVMIANMVEAAKDSHSIFKFIKWTKGEYKFVNDFIFKISEIKDMATSGKSSDRWMPALKRRKAINSVSKLFKNSVLPHTTIIITDYEIEQIAAISGIRLSEVHNALKLIDKYYLLGFGIYDTNSRTLSMMFDGDSDFSSVSISSLKSGNSKEVDLSNMKDVMKLMGRI